LSNFNPESTAIVVIDVQVGVFETDPPPINREEVLKSINRVTAAARAAPTLVIFIQHDGNPNEQWLLPDTAEWSLHFALKVAGNDLIIRKTACDAFYKTELEDYLHSKGIETIVVMGYASDFCIDTTIRSAASKEFRVIVVTDAHTTKDRPVLDAAQIIAHHQWMWSSLICPKGVELLTASEVVRGFCQSGLDFTSKPFLQST